jgi:hypothetical protein
MNVCFFKRRCSKIMCSTEGASVYTYVSKFNHRFFFSCGTFRPVFGSWLSLFSGLYDHTQTRHIRWDSSGRVTSSSQGRLPDNTQHSQETDIHAPSGIRTHNPSKRMAEDPRLRPRGRWDRQPPKLLKLISETRTDGHIFFLLCPCFMNFMQGTHKREDKEQLTCYVRIFL